MIRLASIRDIRGINELLLQVQKVHSDIRPDLFKYIGTKYNASRVLAKNGFPHTSHLRSI